MACPKIEVTFDIDANGIVHVSAKDQGTGKEQSMTISGGSALSKDDIDRMVKDAEQYAEEDANRREAVEARNQADSLVYSTEKFLSENDEKLPEDVKTEVQTDVDELKKLLEDENTDKDALHRGHHQAGRVQPEDGCCHLRRQRGGGRRGAERARARRPPTAPTTTSSTPRSWTRRPDSARKARTGSPSDLRRPRTRTQRRLRQETPPAELGLAGPGASPRTTAGAQLR